MELAHVLIEVSGLDENVILFDNVEDVLGPDIVLNDQQFNLLAEEVHVDRCAKLFAQQRQDPLHHVFVSGELFADLVKRGSLRRRAV